MVFNRKRPVMFPVSDFKRSLKDALFLLRHYECISECKVSAFHQETSLSTVKSKPNGAHCAGVHSTRNGGDRVTCYFRPNVTANNCLTNICMSLFGLLNTVLSNWAHGPGAILRCLLIPRCGIKQGNYEAHLTPLWCFKGLQVSLKAWNLAYWRTNYIPTSNDSLNLMLTFMSLLCSRKNMETASQSTFDFSLCCR